MDARSSMSCSSDEIEILPENLVFQVLLWLPVLTLLRLKSVCKSWCSLIQNPNFIIEHYNHLHITDQEENLEENLVIVNNACPCHHEYLYISLRSGKSRFEQVFETFDLPPSFNSLLPITYPDGVTLLHHNLRLSPMTSYNGVICLDHGFHIKDFSLYNPALKQFRILPEAPFLESILEIIYPVSGGFGFDFRTNDYKVVRIVQEQIRSGYACMIKNTQVDVYSLSANSWKTIDAIVPPITVRSGHGELAYPNPNGVYYCWLADIVFSDLDWSSHKTILSFDFSKEVFETMPLPDVYDINARLQLDLALLKDTIACIETVADGALGRSEFHIWLLGEYGVKESWAKLYTIRLEGFNIAKAFLKNGDIIFMKSDWYQLDESLLCLWNHVNQEIRVLSDQDCLHVTPHEVGVYKESLLSIKAASPCNERVLSHSEVVLLSRPFST